MAKGRHRNRPQTFLVRPRLAVSMAPGGALVEDHLAEAISHTKEAIDDGKIGIRTFLSAAKRRRAWYRG